MTQKKNETKSGINLDAIDELPKGFSGQEEIMARGGLMDQLTKAVVERALRGELSHHRGYYKGLERKSENDEESDSNCHNGYSKKMSLLQAGDYYREPWPMTCQSAGA